MSRLGDKVSKLLVTIDELQDSESTSELSARRAERELREEKERCQMLEREVEGLKAMRVEKASSAFGSVGRSGYGDGLGIEVPLRKSSLSRAPSMTKGFL